MKFKHALGAFVAQSAMHVGSKVKLSGFGGLLETYARPLLEMRMTTGGHLRYRSPLAYGPQPARPPKRKALYYEGGTSARPNIRLNAKRLKFGAAV